MFLVKLKIFNGFNLETKTMKAYPHPRGQPTCLNYPFSHSFPRMGNIPGVLGK